MIISAIKPINIQSTLETSWVTIYAHSLAFSLPMAPVARHITTVGIAAAQPVGMAVIDMPKLRLVPGAVGSMVDGKKRNTINPPVRKRFAF